MTSRGQEMEENQHPSFHSFTALMGDGCEFVSWCHADRKWKKINTHPSTLWQHLWVMVVSSSADVTQTGNGRASTAILPLFDSTCGRWFRVCQLMSHRKQMEEHPHPSFHGFTALEGDGCEFVWWHHADRKWKKINTNPSTLSQHLWVMVVSSSADVTQTEMEEHPHPSFHCFTALVEDGSESVSWHHMDSKWKSIHTHPSTLSQHLWAMVASLSADITWAEMEEHPHPSFYQFTPLEGDGRGSTSWPHTSHSHTDRKWKKVVNHPSTDAHNHNTCRRWSWAHRRTLFEAAWSRLRCHHTRYWDRRLEREMKERGKRARSVEWWSDGDTVSLFNMTLKIKLHPSPQPIPPTHTYPQPHTCTCS